MFPRVPFSASAALPPRRSEQVSLDEAEYFPAQSGCQRRYASERFTSKTPPIFASRYSQTPWSVQDDASHTPASHRSNCAAGRGPVPVAVRVLNRFGLRSLASLITPLLQA